MDTNLSKTPEVIAWLHPIRAGLNSVGCVWMQYQADGVLVKTTNNSGALVKRFYPYTSVLYIEGEDV